MELSNSLVATIFMAIVIVPIMLVARSVSKKKRERIEKADKLREQYQMTFSESDNWDNLVLGMDKARGKLLWFEEGSTADEHLLIDLQKMGKCRPVNTVRSVVVDKQSTQVIEQIGLELLPKDSKESPVFLEFYHEKNLFAFSIQLQLQAKWNRLISTALEGK